MFCQSSTNILAAAERSRVEWLEVGRSKDWEDFHLDARCRRMAIMIYYEEASETILELCYGDNSSSSLAVTIERPVWESIEKGIINSFNFGGC